MSKQIRILAGGLFIAMFWSPVFAGEVDIPNEFEAGDPASADDVNANFETLQSAVNDNAARLTALEPVEEQVPALAFELNDGAELVPLLGTARGGVERTDGGTLQPLPLVIHGLPGPLSEPIRMLDEGRRFNGRVLRLSDGMGTAVINLSNTRMKAIEVPAVVQDADSPFRVSLRFDETSGEADAGPFESEQVTAPGTATAFQPGLELAIDNVGSSTFTPLSIGPVHVFRTSGGILEASPVAIQVAPTDADPLVTAFADGTRLGNPTLRYLTPDGATALEITAEYGEFVSVAPDFTGDGATVGLEFDSSSISRVRVSAP